MTATPEIYYIPICKSDDGPYIPETPLTFTNPVEAAAFVDGYENLIQVLRTEVRTKRQLLHIDVSEVVADVWWSKNADSADFYNNGWSLPEFIRENSADAMKAMGAA